MYCAHCGTEAGASRFCRNCGHPIGGQSSVATSSGIDAAAAPARAVEPVTLTKSKHRSGRWVLRAVWAVSALVIAWATVSVIGESGTKKQRDTMQEQQLAQPSVRHMLTDVAVAPVVLEPGHIVYFKLSVPPQASNVSVEGRFSATGGSGNDVEAFLFDDDGFVNWQNHHTVQTYYSSGRVTQDTLNVRLPEKQRTYYLVFSNTFALLSNKAVSPNIKLRYDQLQ